MKLQPGKTVLFIFIKDTPWGIGSGGSVLGLG